MRLELTKIGNSRGVRIPKLLIEQCGLGDVVEARVTPDGLVLAPRRVPRDGWRQAFLESKSCEDENLLERVSANVFDAEDWKW
jgi:antitoxin MazE